MSDTLETFIRFADNVQANVERANRPAYCETCICGGSVEVGKDVSRADLRRIHANFLGRHRDCVRPAARGFGLLLPPVDDGSDLAPITGGLDEQTECVQPTGQEARP